MKFALVLGGGGARGISHIGVIKVLEENGLVPELITGTSIGALIGASYAVDRDAEKLERRMIDFLNSDGVDRGPITMVDRLNWDNGDGDDWISRVTRFLQKEMFLRIAMFSSSLLAKNSLRSCMEVFLPDIDLTETQIPVWPVCTDLVSGEQVVFKEGPIISAVMASCAVPGYMPPVEADGMLLMDGGIADQLPAGIAKEAGVKVVVSVNVGTELREFSPMPDGIDIISRSMEVMSSHLSREGLLHSDIVISPEVGDIDWRTFDNYKGLIARGETAARAVIDEIRRLLAA